MKTCSKCNFKGEDSLFRKRCNICKVCAAKYAKIYEQSAKCQTYRDIYRVRRKRIEYYLYTQQLKSS